MRSHRITEGRWHLTFFQKPEPWPIATGKENPVLVRTETTEMFRRKITPKTMRKQINDSFYNNEPTC